MVYTDNNKVTLKGRVAVITGANTGIGKETALELSSRGARVIMLCRSMDKAKAAKDEIVAQTHGDVEVMQMDLSSFKSIHDCANKLLDRGEKIDILINNAGIMACPQWKTEDGYEMQFGTNHLGHFLLTELLRPLIKKAATDGYRPRIVIVSSLMHEYGTMNFDDLNFEKKSYSEWGAYGQSKLANVLHAKELARRVEADGISVYSLHPGAVKTDLQKHSLDAWYGCFMRPFRSMFFITPKQGAQTTLYCCLEPKIANDSGLYYSDCKEKTAAPKARDEKSQKKLWEISENMVGLASPPNSGGSRNAWSS